MTRDLRALLRGRPDADDAARRSFSLASKILFLILLITAAILAAAAGPIIGAIIIGPLIGAGVYVILPIQRMRDRANWIYSGEAGEDFYNGLRDRSQRLRRRFNR